MNEPVRIAVIGVGRVGASFAFNLLLSGLAAEIVLVDADRDRAEGEAMDLSHAVPFSHPTRVWAGRLDDCADAAIVVVTAGAAQGPGQSRMDLARTNAGILRQVLEPLAGQDRGRILIMATNPVDVMTRLALELTGWPPGRVIGSGTTLDTARLRHQLGLHFGIDPRNIHAYIVGEHGDTEVPVWSSASIAGVPLEDACKLLGIACSPEGMAALRKKVYRSTRDAAFEIIDRKGATSYGIATALVRIAAAILRDEKTILTVSSFQGPIHGLGDICLSLPSVIGRDGRERVIEQPLEVAELSLLRQSAERIIAVYERLE